MDRDTKGYNTTAGQKKLKRHGLKPLPQPDSLTAPYWEAARKHQLKIQQCCSCKELQHPPHIRCQRCGCEALEWTTLDGRGEVYSFVIDRRLLIPGFDEPYVVAQVNPVEAQRDSVRITANIRGCEPEAVYIGMPVEVVFEERGEDTVLPQFRPVNTGLEEETA